MEQDNVKEEVEQKGNAVTGQEMPPGSMTVKPPSSKVFNCNACAPVAVPSMCSWLNPMKEASPAGSCTDSRTSYPTQLRTLDVNLSASPGHGSICFPSQPFGQGSHCLSEC
eukprot:4568649-Pyramimonas_sp.AAC.2